MKWQPGDDVWVDFDGKEHRGEVVSSKRGYVVAIIEIDPVWDYGRMGPRLAPLSHVCVPESRVRAYQEGGETDGAAGDNGSPEEG